MRIRLAMGLAAALGLAILVRASLPECRAGGGERQELTREFILNSPYSAVEEAVSKWQLEGERAAMALKEIALSSTRDAQERWNSVQDMHRVNPQGAEGWYVLNVSLRVALPTYRSEAVPGYPCASALVNMGWASVGLLVSAAESKQEAEWMRLAGAVIRLVAGKQAHAVVAALERSDTGLLKHLGE